MNHSHPIRNAAVLGAGMMGSGIAAHLANCGIPVLLMDVPPKELNEKEKSAGLTVQDRKVRNRLATEAVERMARDRRTPFFDPADAALIETGNTEDDLGRLGGVDWIIEAVTEDEKVKRALYEKVEKVHRIGCVISTNTSGIPLRRLVKGRGDSFATHFLGVHFFNPVRWMYLVEIIPAKTTEPAVVQTVSRVVRESLGKGVVVCKDTPNFIANRIGFFEMVNIPRLVLEHGLTVEETDALLGPIAGRPRTAFFRLMDLVGVDVAHLVSLHTPKSLRKDEWRDRYVSPPFYAGMTKRGMLGDKSGGGFYKQAKGPSGTQSLALDLSALEYREAQKPDFPILQEAASRGDVRERLRFLASQGDRAGRFLWAVLSDTLVYAANRIPEIANDIVSVDQTMRWGFSWELGPFETWDALGVKEVVARLEKEGRGIPELARRVLDSPSQAFYGFADGRSTYFHARTGKQRPVPRPENVIRLSEIEQAGKAVKESAHAALFDLGDGAACLELRGPGGVVPYEAADFLRGALEAAESRFRGLLIAGRGGSFCAGPDLQAARQWAAAGDWAAAEAGIKALQSVAMAVKYSRIPIVAAVQGPTMGAGAELAMTCARVQAAPELRMGLTDVLAGLSPAAGGLKEWVIRADEAAPGDDDNLIFPFILETINMLTRAQTSFSAPEARRMGWLRRGDTMSINRETLVFHAKHTALALADAGYRAPHQRANIRVLGESGLSELKSTAWNLSRAHFISDYDRHIVGVLSNVLCGGALMRGSVVNEPYLLDLEREAFLSLLKEAKTQERIESLLATGRAKRN